MYTLKQLATANHPYYCSESNYYSNDAAMHFDTAADFLDYFEGYDIDLNLCFRWDVRENMNDDDTAGLETYCAEVFLMLQRKGIFKPCSIRSISEHEVGRFVDYLQKHHDTLKQMWNPISK